MKKCETRFLEQVQCQDLWINLRHELRIITMTVWEGRDVERRNSGDGNDWEPFAGVDLTASAINSPFSKQWEESTPLPLSNSRSWWTEYEWRSFSMMHKIKKLDNRTRLGSLRGNKEGWFNYCEMIQVAAKTTKPESTVSQKISSNFDSEDEEVFYE